MTWWQELLMYIGGAAVLFFLWTILKNLLEVRQRFSLQAERKKESMRLTDMRIEMLKIHLRTVYEMSENYDKRHGIELPDEKSALRWFYGKYSFDELVAMDSDCFLLNELYTEEELLKVGS